jgi:hypothetical protein
MTVTLLHGDRCGLDVSFGPVATCFLIRHLFGFSFHCVKEQSMRTVSSFFLGFILCVGLVSDALADEYQETIGVFKSAGASAWFFDNSYGYAVFPSVTKAGVIAGGAHGEGRVFVAGEHVGDVVMTQVSLGFQLGGQKFSQIVFFQDERAFNEFTAENFELGAHVNAVAITAAASAAASTAGGTQAGASTSPENATTAGVYYKGLAVFTVARGGAMFEASVAGQTFEFTPR